MSYLYIGIIILFLAALIVIAKVADKEDMEGREEA
jgi:hypothetical protein